METVGVSKLRENLMVFLKKVQNGETVTITSRGHEVARLVPPESETEEARKALQKLGETAVIGDILSPIGEEWEAMK